MNEAEFQVREIERARRRKPSFMLPCVVEQGLIIPAPSTQEKPK